MLAHHLDARFDSFRVIKKWFVTPWAAVLQTGQKSYSMVLGKSKYEKDEWVLLVGPSETPGLFDLLRGRKPVAHSPELQQVCREIHAALTAISGITAVRWYFEGFHSQTAAVATPDELPWKGNNTVLPDQG